jgi:hypothetical protein
MRKHQNVAIFDLCHAAELGREEVLGNGPERAVDAKVQS